MTSDPLDQDFCEVCKLMGQRSTHAGPVGIRVTCKRCGTFTWNPLLFMLPTTETKELQVTLSAFIQEQNAAGIVPHLTEDLIRQVERTPIPRLRERALRALAAMAEEVGNDAQRLHPFRSMPRIQAVSYSADEEELDVLIRILEHEKFVGISERGDAHLTIEGLLKAEELSLRGSAYVQGFVAMSFDHSWMRRIR